MAGKGDKPRPINKKTYDFNFEKINWNSNLKNKPINVKKIKGKITYKY